MTDLNNLEQGAASLLVSLSNGQLKVTHGTGIIAEVSPILEGV